MIVAKVDVSDVLRELNILGSSEKLTNALAEAGEIVRADAVKNCPVDTGNLRQSIVVEAEGNTALIGPTAVNEQGKPYGIYVEFGTGSKGDSSVPHTTKSGWVYFAKGEFHYTTGQAPQPYLVPALFDNEARIKDKIREAYNV